MNPIKISVIVPHRNAVRLVPTLFASIPVDPRIEIILVDNSPARITKDDIITKHDYTLLYSDPARGAGGARNVGIENANGEWLIFADADDFFAEKAFSLFLAKTDSHADIIYTGMGGVFLDTGEHSDRGDGYARLVKSYLVGEKTEKDLRLGFPSPCCKMIKSQFVKCIGVRFDEICAGNDIYFSTVCGLLANKIEAVDQVTYIATVSRGTLTQRRDFDVIKARLFSKLHCNEFLKKQGLPKRQHSVMFELIYSLKFGIKEFCECIRMVIDFNQNPFIGYKHWLKGVHIVANTSKSNKKYITQ